MSVNKASESKAMTLQ